MAEKRKPCLIIMLRMPGSLKAQKAELFKANQWDHQFFNLAPRVNLNVRFRVRVNGKWFNTKDGDPLCLTKYQFRDTLFRSVHFRNL